jgi:hypothetical protein
VSASDPTSSRTETPPNVGEIVEMVKAYAIQETVGPLKGAGRWLGVGAAGALLLALGLFFALLGILRLLQTEAAETFDGGWSWVPYLIVLLLCVGATALALSRVRKSTLGKEPR